MAKHHNNMHNGVLDSSMKVGFQMNLKDAIEDCGVDVPSSICLWQYPELIRSKLIANTVGNVNIKGKDIINITTDKEDGQICYTLSTSYDTSNIDRPNYAEDDESWGQENNVKTVLNDLFTNILPAVRGVHSGDTVDTNDDGIEINEWNNPLFKQSGLKTGLRPSSKYIRLYLTCQAEPIYIYFGNFNPNTENGYDLLSSETVRIDTDSTNKVMTANILRITEDIINQMN